MINYKQYRDFMEAKFYMTKEAEKKWLQSLKSIPNGIMIFNLKDNQVIFENDMMRDILCNSNTHEDDPNNIESKDFENYFLQAINSI